MSHKLLILTLGLLLLTSSGLLAQTAANWVLTNISVITANNVAVASQHIATTTVRTMWGGRFHRGLVGAATAWTQYITAGGTATWVVRLTNKGNLTGNFDNRTNSTGLSGTGWSISIGDYLGGGNIPAGTATTATLRITAASTAVDGTFYHFRIYATNVSQPRAGLARRYTGDNGIVYGGDIGCDWTGTTNSTHRGRVPLVHPTGVATAAFLRAIVQAPILQVRKSIELITDPAGYGQGTPVPGSRIHFRIHVTNRGTAAAVNAILRDTWNTSYMSYVTGSTQISTNTTSGGLWYAKSVANGQIIWTNASFAAGQRAVFRFRTTVN